MHRPPGRIHSENPIGNAGFSMAGQTADPQNLSPSHLQRNIPASFTRHIHPQMLDFQNDILFKGAIHIHETFRLQLSAHHQFCNLMFVCVFRLFVKHHLSVTENHNRIRQLNHFIQTVADKNNRDSGICYLADAFQEALRLALCQNCCRFVQNQKL